MRRYDTLIFCCYCFIIIIIIIICIIVIVMIIITSIVTHSQLCWADLVYKEVWKLSYNHYVHEGYDFNIYD